VTLSLFGSSVADQLQNELQTGYTGQDGSYRLSWAGAGHGQDFLSYIIVVTDPRYELRQAISGTGGQVTADGWIVFEHPAVAAYDHNDFYLRLEPTPAPASSQTPSGTPSPTRTATPSASATRTSSATPQRTATPTATSSVTPPPAVFLYAYGFGGHVYHGNVGHHHPLGNVQVSMYGSDEPDGPGILLAQARSGTDGAFYVQTSGPTPGPTYFNVVLDDPAVVVNAVEPGSRGNQVSLSWIQFSPPLPPFSFDTNWYVSAAPKHLSALAPLKPIAVSPARSSSTRMAANWRAAPSSLPS
jgi:hypothetical protein